MNRSEILIELNQIFKETLENEFIVLSDETSASDIDEWDSLSHILLVVAIEKEFKIRFNSNEIRNWNSVGEIIDSILTKNG